MSNIIDTYKAFIRKKATSGGRRPGLHVSDLVSDCLRKSWYRMHDKDKQPEPDDASIDNFYYGTAIHDSFEGMSDIMEYKMCINPYEEIIEDEIIAIDAEMKKNPYKWVSGSLDMILDNTIVDFKTCAKLPSKNHLSYIKQINFYAYMYFLHTDVKIKKGANLYLEKSSGFHNIRLFEFDILDYDLIRDTMIFAMDEIAADEPPEKVPSHFCKTCPYLNVCKPF